MYYNRSLCADQIETSTSPPPPPPQANPGHLTIFCAREWGIWRVRPSRGWGIWPCLGGVGKIEPEVSGFKSLFWGGAEVANSYKHVFGRDTALQKKLTKKGLQKWECLNINYFYRLYINDVHFLYNESSCGFIPQWIVKDPATRTTFYVAG